MIEMSDLAVYGGLFSVAFVAATLLPAQSEAVLTALLIPGAQPPWALIAVAGTGNVLGSVVNWVIGRGLEQLKSTSWLRQRTSRLELAQRWYGHYGNWSLLLSWVPLVGDPLTVVAGAMREPLWRFVALVTLAKFGRYLVLSAVVLSWHAT